MPVLFLVGLNVESNLLEDVLDVIILKVTDLEGQLDDSNVLHVLFLGLAHIEHLVLHLLRSHSNVGMQLQAGGQIILPL